MFSSDNKSIGLRIMLIAKFWVTTDNRYEWPWKKKIHKKETIFGKNLQFYNRMCLKRCCIVRATIEFVAMLHRRCLSERMQWITEGISDQHCHQAANARDSWSMSTDIRQMIRGLRVEPAQCQPTSVFDQPLADQTSSWAPTTAYIWMGIKQRQPAMPISMALKMDQAPNRQPQKMQPQQPPLNYKWPLLIAIAAIHSA